MFGLSTIALRWIGGAVLVLLLLGAVYAKGWLDRDKDFSKYKVEVKAAAMAQEEATKRAITAQEQITKRTEVKYEKDISTLRAVYNRLRGTTGGSAMSTVPNPATDPAQATAYYLDVAPELATQCGETTQQLVSLQEWIADQSQVAQ